MDGVNIGLRFVTECFVPESREGREGVASEVEVRGPVLGVKV